MTLRSQEKMGKKAFIFTIEGTLIEYLPPKITAMGCQRVISSRVFKVFAGNECIAGIHGWSNR